MYKNRGFSLLEVLVVIFIISLFSAVVWPWVSSTLKEGSSSEIDHLAATLRYIRDSSAQYKKSFRVEFNFKENSVTYEVPEGRRVMKTTTLIGIKIPSKGLIKEGELSIVFGPEGYPEPFLLYFQDTRCISYNPFSMLIEVREKDSCHQ
jgi:prepilin-type N-terminal cleavage/methylation domain-containing protein